MVHEIKLFFLFTLGEALPKRMKQVHAYITPFQKQVLMKIYLDNPYPVRERLIQIAIVTNLTIQRVRNWFVYARYKERKKELWKGEWNHYSKITHNIYIQHYTVGISTMPCRYNEQFT